MLRSNSFSVRGTLGEEVCQQPKGGKTMIGIAAPAQCLASSLASGRVKRTCTRAPGKAIIGARSLMILSAALLVLLIPLPARAAVTCAAVLQALGSSLTDVRCFVSLDLTTNNPLTTPIDN